MKLRITPVFPVKRRMWSYRVPFRSQMDVLTPTYRCFRMYDTR